MRNKRQVDIEDDGRVIAPMNIEGMPWYAPPRNARKPDSGGGGTQRLTRRENLAFMAGVLKAVLLTAGIFIGALFAFILFCTEVWFA